MVSCHSRRSRYALALQERCPNTVQHVLQRTLTFTDSSSNFVDCTACQRLLLLWVVSRGDAYQGKAECKCNRDAECFQERVTRNNSAVAAAAGGALSWVSHTSWSFSCAAFTS